MILSPARGDLKCVAATLFVALSPLWVRSVSAENSFGGSVTVASDYRVRGISQTYGEPALQGGAHLRSVTGWMAGIWASTINRNPGRSATSELDIYLGFNAALAPDWDMRVAATHYWYPNDPARVSYDYDELSASLAYRSQLVATVTWSPKATYFGYYDGRWKAQRAVVASYELAGTHPLTDVVSLTLGVGYSDLTRLFDRGYWYWNAGMSCAIGPLRLDIARIDTDGAAENFFGAKVTDAGWSAALSWRF